MQRDDRQPRWPTAVTTIEAAACEPEVVDLGNYLNRMGAKITGLGTPFLHIEGVERLTACEHTIIPDRIEAATLMIAAAITQGDVVLDNINIEHMTAIVEKLREIGVTIDVVGTAARVTVRRELKAADCIMLPYPGLPTDVQAQFMALLTTVPGISIVTDKVFPDRFMHAAGTGADGGFDPPRRTERDHQRRQRLERRQRHGVRPAGLGGPGSGGPCRRGDSVIRRIYHLDRGYDRLEIKLNDLGAGIVRAQDIPLNMPASLSISPAEMLPSDDGDHELRGRNGSAPARTCGSTPPKKSSDVAWACQPVRGVVPSLATFRPLYFFARHVWTRTAATVCGRGCSEAKPRMVKSPLNIPSARLTQP